MRAGAGPEHSPGEGRTDPRTTSGAQEATPPCGHHRPPGSEQPLPGEARDVRAQTVGLAVASPLLRATVPLAEMLSGTPSHGGAGLEKEPVPPCLSVSQPPQGSCHQKRSQTWAWGPSHTGNEPALEQEGGPGPAGSRKDKRRALPGAPEPPLMSAVPFLP